MSEMRIKMHKTRAAKGNPERRLLFYADALAEAPITKKGRRMRSAQTP